MNALQGTHQRAEKVEELEGIRGLAAFLIVIFHLPKWNPILDIRFLNNGYLMVDLFFVLSGFVIFKAYSEKIQSKNDLFKFQFLRFGRLYPIHLIFLFVFVFFEFGKYLVKTKLGIETQNSIPFENNNLSAFLKNIFLISSILPSQSESYNYPSWSVSVEFYTYWVFSLIILLFKNNKVKFFYTLALISIIMLVTEKTFGFDLLVRCFAGFFIGTLTANLTRNIESKFNNHLSLIIFISILIFLQFKTTKSFDFMIYFLSAALIVSLVLTSNGVISKILKFKFLNWLGTISYSIYMSHASVVWVAVQVIRFVLEKPDKVGIDGKYSSQLSEIETLGACFFVVISVLLVSVFVYKFIEKPMRDKSRRFVSSLK